MKSKNLFTKEQWAEERRKFREKCIVACVQENFELQSNPTQKKPLGALIYDMCEECFLMGESFAGEVYTDEEMAAIVAREEKKLDDMGSPLPK